MRIFNSSRLDNNCKSSLNRYFEERLLPPPTQKRQSPKFRDCRNISPGNQLDRWHFSRAVFLGEVESQIVAPRNATERTQGDRSPKVGDRERDWTEDTTEAASLSRFKKRGALGIHTKSSTTKGCTVDANLWGHLAYGLAALCGECCAPLQLAQRRSPLGR
jgi:hypothetical protein